jgi:hypothetical protein
VAVSAHPAVLNSHKLDSIPGNTGITTFTGHIFDIFNPDTWTFDLEDISQALSATCRFGGHVEFYSVAEHCIRVADILKDWGATPQTQLIGLLHDAIEAYIGDIPRPIKKTFVLDGESILELEKSMEYALFASFDLLHDDFDAQWLIVKQADMRCYELERDERPSVGNGIQPTAAKRMWLHHFEYLSKQIG